MQSLIEVLKDLGYLNKIQVSMDGPSVNWALLNNLPIHRKEDFVNIGSCDLHIVHGSFGTASKKTDWNLEASLKSFYKNFKNSSARRADYLELNGLNEIHDQKCSSTKIKGLFKQNKKDSDTKTYKTFKVAVNDVMLPIILEYRRTVSTTMEPFLRCFQSEKPMAVFLYEKFGEIMSSLTERFVRSEVFLANSSTITLLRINLDDVKVLLPAWCKGFD